jgi:hypothetical protein
MSTEGKSSSICRRRKAPSARSVPCRCESAYVPCEKTTRNGASIWVSDRVSRRERSARCRVSVAHVPWSVHYSLDVVPEPCKKCIKDTFTASRSSSLVPLGRPVHRPGNFSLDRTNITEKHLQETDMVHMETHRHSRNHSSRCLSV